MRPRHVPGQWVGRGAGVGDLDRLVHFQDERITFADRAAQPIRRRVRLGCRGGRPRPADLLRDLCDVPASSQPSQRDRDAHRVLPTG
ncbi:hypothetical protein [Actinoplanes subglobosus]|uniref:Uncharacterized protein n=1 Tax=Actinoplanes subglobosus TaxID=1547892 RepID=A0ABV8ISI8_9ACTN